MTVVNGGEADRIPFSFWYHFPLEFPSGKPLAEAELAFMERYDTDFLKIMHDLPLELPNGMNKIEDPKDWNRFAAVKPRTSNLKNQLEALRLIKAGLRDDAPVIDTIFDPFASANKLCGKKIMEHYNAEPEAVKHALSAIAESLAAYVTAWFEEGGDGIFYALDGAMITAMKEDLYREVFLPLDEMILNIAAKRGQFNVLHLHGTGIMFDMAHTLPCHVLNWSSALTWPDLKEGRNLHKGCIAGGINEMDVAMKSPEEVNTEAKEAIESAGKPGFILTPGCAVPTNTPPENLLAIRDSV